MARWQPGWRLHALKTNSVPRRVSTCTRRTLQSSTRLEHVDWIVRSSATSLQTHTLTTRTTTSKALLDSHGDPPMRISAARFTRLEEPSACALGTHKFPSKNLQNPSNSFQFIPISFLVCHTKNTKNTKKTPKTQSTWFKTRA